MSSFHFGSQPSEEEIEAMKQYHQRQQMQMDEFRHAHQRLFEELNEDQLMALKHMFHFIVESSASILAAQWDGEAAHALKARFNICMTCGVNHDKEVQAPEEPPRKEDTLLPMFAWELSKKDKELMELYHLDDLRIEGTDELVGFACTGINGMSGPCGVTYPSIADRMLKGPEECSGCFIKMGHG